MLLRTLTDNPRELKRILDIANRVCEIREGATLMRLAERCEYKIYLNPKILKRYVGLHLRELKIIQLNPAYNNDELTFTIAHELRHLWQSQILDISDSARKGLSPRSRIVLARIEEGDAHAFECFFRTKLKWKRAGERGRYRREWWREDFLRIQSNLSSYDKRSVRFGKLTGGMKLPGVMKKYRPEQILCRGLDLRASYWGEPESLADELLSFVDAKTLRSCRA